jgi:hypothetical protein
MVCAGFVFLDLPEGGTNDAAEEGTAAGEYLERLLLGKPTTEVSSNGVFFDDDIKFHGNAVYEEILTRVAPDSTVKCEQRIDWQTSSGVWIKGQYDISFVDTKGRLCIEDLKYGWGIVEVKENWQLLGYAIGEIIRRGQAFSEISLKIHQPRPHHEDGSTREWILTYSELLEYKAKIEHRMQELVDGRKDLQTSAKCKYCPGTQEACPAFSRLFYRALEVSTEFYQDSLNNDEVAAQMDQVKRALEVIKIKSDSLTELATARIKKGEIVPGYVTTKKYSNREWNAGITPVAIKAMTGIDVVETKFMTPAKAEKLGLHKDLVSQLTKRKFIGSKLEKRNSTEVGNKIFGNTKPNGGN